METKSNGRNDNKAVETAELFRFDTLHRAKAAVLMRGRAPIVTTRFTGSTAPRVAPLVRGADGAARRPYLCFRKMRCAQREKRRMLREGRAAMNVACPYSPLKNYGYRRFIQNRAPTRRDEGEYSYGSSTEEQRSRRPVFDETLRAEVFLSLCFVASRSQILEDMLPRRFAHKAKNPLSGCIHSFLTGC